MREPNVDVTVRAIAAGGSGVGDLPDGRVVFVPRTAPGDRARIRIETSKARWAVGSLRRIIEPGPDRRDALCALYAECGGCQMQHLSYKTQLEWKGRFVTDALRRIGRLDVVAFPEVVPSARTIGYRNRVTFTLRRLRGGHVVAGFHALGRPAHVVDVRGECVLPEPGLVEVWKSLRESWGQAARLLPAGGRLRLTLRAAPLGPELLVEGGEAGWSAKQLAARVPALVAVHHRAATLGAEATLVHGGTETALGAAFLQVNREVAAALKEHVVAVAGRGTAAIDAYCGVGEFGRALALNGWRVTGIELDRSAVAIATKGAPEGFSVVSGSVEERLGELLPAELLVVNPPRTGLHAAIPPVIAAAPPERLVYVSCDPATLARDLRSLSDAYELEGVRSFDLFPQTAHVETVAVMALRVGDR